MSAERRLTLAASLGMVLVIGAGVSDFLVASFWERHSLLTSLVANLLVVAVTVAVVNQWVEMRDRKRWSLLAQSVLFALIQTARATWTGLVEVLELGEVRSGAVEPLLEAAAIARDPERVSPAIRSLLADAERRTSLQRLAAALSEHAASVIADWAPVMVSARTYASVLDRHVELAGRLEWLNNVLAHNAPGPEQSLRERSLTRSSVATEHAEALGSDDWLEDQILALLALATELDYQSREQAFTIVPGSWWAQRTAGLAGRPEPGDEAVGAPVDLPDTARAAGPPPAP
jgi:hypothetical protein